MKIVSGYAPLPARLASLKERAGDVRRAGSDPCPGVFGGVVHVEVSDMGETKKNVPGYAPLPARSASIKERVGEDRRAGSDMYPGVAVGVVQVVSDAL